MGGSGLKLAYVGVDGALQGVRGIPIADLLRSGDVVDGIVAGVQDAVSNAPSSLNPRSVGLAVPGIVDEASGVGRVSFLLGWHDVPFRRLVAEATGVPVAFGHDVRTGALAEGRLGGGRGFSDWLFLALGTGLGAAFVLNGVPYRGANGYGGELAHVVAATDGPHCRCGKRGCAEMLASASAIASRYSAAVGSSKDVSSAEVVRRLKDGDPVAARIWSEAITALAAVVAGFVESMNPSAVVIGGGLADAGDLLLVPLTKCLIPQIRFARPLPEIRAAQLGVHAGLHGAALLGLEAMGEGGARDAAGASRVTA